MGFVHGVDHIYVICSHKHEPERYNTIVKTFETMGIDKSNYTFSYFKHGSEISPAEAFKVYNPWMERPTVPGEQKNFNRYNLKLSEISLSINWAHVALQAIRDAHKVVLILESDPVFEDNFVSKLDTAMKELDSKEWDSLCIGFGVDIVPKRQNNIRKWIPAPGYYHTNTTVAHIYKVDMLKKICSTFFPFAEPTDWELNYQLQRHNSKTLWLDPMLIKNGSCAGDSQTTL